MSTYTAAQQRVDQTYKHLVNTQYDVSHGHATPDALRRAEAYYQDALRARDDEAREVSR